MPHLLHLPIFLRWEVVLFFFLSGNLLAQIHGYSWESVPFQQGLNGYHTYRIPTVIKTDKTVLAFAEARKFSANDFGTIDLVLRRSVDNGQTWLPLQFLWNQDSLAVQNPVPIYDRIKKRLVLLFNTTDMNEHDVLNAVYDSSKKGRRAFVIFSDDEGKSWSTPRDITSQVKRHDWRWHALGPVHGIQLQKTRPNRLVAPVSISIGKGNKVYSMALLYSDDHGETWHIGAVDENLTDACQSNETSIAELSNGSIYVNTRDQYGGSTLMNRGESVSNDGGETFDMPTLESKNFPSPVVQASVLTWSFGEEEVLLFTSPSHPDKREDLILMASFDQAQTWHNLGMIHPGAAAYSDMVQLNDRLLGILVETDSYKKITFYTIDLQKRLTQDGYR